MRRQLNNRAFTLIELLVVVAIIAMLISILLPSLAKARDMARGVVCLSDQRQLGFATGMYLNDYDSTYPASTTAVLESKNVWFVSLDPYLGQTADDSTRAGVAGERSYDKFKQDPVWQTIPNEPENVLGTQNLREANRTIKMNWHFSDTDDPGRFTRDGELYQPTMIWRHQPTR